MRLTRRAFVASAAATAAAHALHAQGITAHSSVAEIERTHILASAADAEKATIPAGFAPLHQFSTITSALAAAFLLTKEQRYADKAAAVLKQWLAQLEKSPAPTPLESREAILNFVPLAELARACSFLVDQQPPDQAAALTGYFATILSLLNHDPQAQLARDTKDHRASAWLLVAAACARATRNEIELDKLRLRFKKPALRNQISLEGKFPQELATDNPLRNTLFNFDLLAGACQLLTSPFDDLWKFELIEGTGMRSCGAYIYPFLKEPANWPAIADAQDFREVPLRRPALLFAGRAYSRDEYVQLFASLPTPNPPPEIAYSLPVTQPILWATRAPHGL